MELRHLRYFVATVEAGTVSAAAGRLHLTQPGLSRQLRQLELDLGVELFERSRWSPDGLPHRAGAAAAGAGPARPSGGAAGGGHVPRPRPPRSAHHRRSDGHADRRRVAVHRDPGARRPDRRRPGRRRAVPGRDARCGARTSPSGRVRPQAPYRSRAWPCCRCGPTCPRGIPGRLVGGSRWRSCSRSR